MIEPTAVLTDLEKRIAELEQERDKLLSDPDYAVRPFSQQPESHQTYTAQWLKANQKVPREIKWSLYPIGMVGRWIERAKFAEAELRTVREALTQALPWLLIHSASDKAELVIEMAERALAAGEKGAE